VEAKAAAIHPSEAETGLTDPAACNFQLPVMYLDRLGPRVHGAIRNRAHLRRNLSSLDMRSHCFACLDHAADDGLTAHNLLVVPPWVSAHRKSKSSALHDGQSIRTLCTTCVVRDNARG
jgi:hypothetical protein